MENDLKPRLLWGRIEHLVKNKLQRVLGGGFLIESGLKSADLKTIERGWRIVSSNQAGIMRCINHLILLGQYPQFQPERCDLGEQVQMAIAEIETQPESAGLPCEIEYLPASSPYLAWVEPYLFRSAIFGLLQIVLAAICDTKKENKVIVSHLPNGIELICQDPQFDLESILKPDSALDHRLREALLIEWDLAEFAIKYHGGTIVTGKADGLFWFKIELPSAELTT